MKNKDYAIDGDFTVKKCILKNSETFCKYCHIIYNKKLCSYEEYKGDFEN